MRAPALAAFLILAVPSAARAQDTLDLPPRAEGPLQNDAFLPTSREAGDDLAAGDAALARSRAGGPDSGRLRSEAFDAWSLALTRPDASGEGRADALVWHATERQAADGGGTPRLATSVTDAVLQRITSLSEEERAAWCARVGEVAAGELRAAGSDATRLADVERTRPGTAAAARATVLLADLALEEGRPHLARGWCARGAAHLALCAPADAATAALLGVRRDALDGLLETAPAQPEAWRTADSLARDGFLAWPQIQRRFVARFDPGPGSGVRPGLAFLDDGRIAVQTEDELIMVTRDPRRGLEVESTFEPARLAGPVGEPMRGVETNGAPGWPFLPASNGDDLILVVGRSHTISDFGGGRETIHNALVCVTPAPRRGTPVGVAPQTELLLPRLRWAVAGGLRVEGDDGPVVDSGLADLPAFEFQPGPLVVGSQVLVQARSTEGDVRAWLLAFDLGTGELRWRVLLAQGSDLVVRRGRNDADPLLRRLASQPPTLIPGPSPRVFAGTHLGAGALVDPLDGRVHWVLLNRRRDPAEPAWDGTRPPLRSGDGPLELLWAPADSDRLYTLDPRPPVGPGGVADLWTRPPHPVDERTSLVGGDPAGLVVLGRSGAFPTVRALRDGGARRLEGVYLGRGEEFAGLGLVSAARTLVVSDRSLYLFDNAREMYLLDVVALEDPGRRAGGELYARGDEVLVVGTAGLWSFRAR